MPRGMISLLDITTSSSDSLSNYKTASKVDPNLLMNLYWILTVNNFGSNRTSPSSLIVTIFRNGFISFIFIYSYRLSMRVVFISMLLDIGSLTCCLMRRQLAANWRDSAYCCFIETSKLLPLVPLEASFHLFLPNAARLCSKLDNCPGFPQAGRRYIGCRWRIWHSLRRAGRLLSEAPEHLSRKSPHVARSKT